MYLFYTLIEIVTIFSSLQSSAAQIVSSYNFPPAQIEAANSLARDEFPASFKFGFSISAYQNEGAWNVSDKGINIWDYMLHEYPDAVIDGSNGDVATDFYHKYKEDIQLARNVGTNIFRISINWPRLLPTGFTNHISEDGVRFYNDVINELLANGITPIITLFHAELPYTMYRLGSFLNPLMIDLMTDYAKVAFTYFGDRVKLWVTINEMEGMCVLENNFIDPFSYNLSGIMEYECFRNSLLTHARIYHMYKREFASMQKGKIGVTFSAMLFEGKTDSERDSGTARDANYWVYNHVLDFMFGEGDISARMKDRLNYLSYIQYFPKSRLPTYTDREKRLIKRSADFLGLNFYHATAIGGAPYEDIPMSYHGDIGSPNQLGEDLGEDVNRFTTTAFREYVYNIQRWYDLPEIYITETGYLADNELRDLKRAVFIYEMFEVVLGFLKDGVDVRGFMIWSFTDNFTWRTGFAKRIGIFSIDFNNATLPRSPKFSAKLVENIYKHKYLRPLSEIYAEKKDVEDLQEFIRTADLELH